MRAIAEVFALGASAITVLWVARALGPENLGLLAVALTTLAFAQALTDFGLPSLGAQLVVMGASRAQATYRRVTLLRSIAAIPVAGLVLIVAALPALEDLRLYLSAAGIALLLHPLNAGWLLVAVGALGRAAVIRAVPPIVTLGAAVFAIRSPADSGNAILMLIVPLLTSALISTVVLLAFGLRGPLAPNDADADVLPLGRALHYALADLSLLTYTYADRVLLFLLVGPTVVGLYDAAHRVIQPFYAISIVLREAYFVDLATHLNRPPLEQTLDKFVRLMCLITIPVGPFLTLFSGGVIQTLYGVGYAGSTHVLALLGWSISIGFVSGVVVLPFLAWNRGREYGRALLVGNLANLVVNAVAIPPLGGMGAAIASVCSKAAVAVHGWRTFHDSSRYPLASRIAPYIVASLVAVAVASLARVAADTDLIAAAAFVVGYGGSILTWWSRRRFPASIVTRRVRG